MDRVICAVIAEKILEVFYNNKSIKKPLFLETYKIFLRLKRTKMQMAFANRMFFTCGLNFCLDSTDDCIVIPRGEAYEFLHPGRSSKSVKQPLKQFKPHRKLKHPGSYRGFPEAFITLQNLVDFFFSNGQI